MIGRGRKMHIVPLMQGNQRKPRERMIVRQQLHDKLLAELRDMIIRGDLKAGEKIPERRLCDMFNVSRTPLREALKVLAFEGFVKLNPNRGATIARVTYEEIAETFPIMGAVEALAGELACKRMTDAEIATVRSLHDRMVGEYQRRELQPYFSTNQQIHECIQMGARNEALYAIYRSLAGRVRCARLLANIDDDRWAAAMAEHELIIKALEARDGQALSSILKLHINNKFESLGKSVLKGDTSPVPFSGRSY